MGIHGMNVTETYRVHGYEYQQGTLELPSQKWSGRRAARPEPIAGLSGAKCCTSITASQAF